MRTEIVDVYCERIVYSKHDKVKEAVHTMYHAKQESLNLAGKLYTQQYTPSQHRECETTSRMASGRGNF